MKTLPFISFVTFMRLLTSAEPQFLILFNGDDNICHRVLMFIKRKNIVSTLHRLQPEQVVSGVTAFSFLTSRFRRTVSVYV